MGKNKTVEIFILGLWLLIVVMLLVRYWGSERSAKLPSAPLPDNHESIQGKRVALKRIVVVDGDTYDVTTRDGDKRILVDLDVVAVPDVRQKVTQVLNKSKSPELLLGSRKPDGKWSGSIFFSLDGRETELSRWLADNKLTYE